MSRNNVRGPTSALTEFLKESGITPTTIARRARTAQQPVAGPSNPTRNAQNGENAGGAGVSAGASVAPAGGRAGRQNAGFVSDDLDEEDEEEPAQKKRKLTQAAKAKLKAKAKAKQKQKGGDDLDSENLDEDEDEYTALPKSLRRGENASPSKPPVGSFGTCQKCEKEFTVTKYTVAAKPGPGWLCHPCAKESGIDPFKKVPAPRKRKAPTERRAVVSFVQRALPSLATMCIQIISRHIDDVQALGDIGAVNLDAISRAISKSRGLTPQNVHLFYDVCNTDLTLYDATNLTPPALSTLAYLNPGLTSLRLDFCGRIDDSVMDTWSTAFPALKRLDLHAPFLIRVPAWKKFFESHPHLEAFLITQSPRFDIECIESLVTNCPDLKELRLREIGKMEDGFADHLTALEGKLTVLDLSEPGESMSEDVLIDLVAVVGPTLTHLDLSKHNKITDAFLDEGLKPHTRVLTSLTLNHVPDLTDEGVASFFTTWASPAAQGEGQQDPNPALTAVDLSRNCNLSSTALSTLLLHSGGRLQHLNINGWKTASRESLEQIARFARDLRTLDVGFCHKADDFVLKEILDKCERITEIKCFGCNRVSESCPRKRNVNISGVECHVY